MSDAMTQARAFAERFGIENHQHWVPDGDGVLTVIGALAALLTETRTKALSEKEAEIARLRKALQSIAKQPIAAEIGDEEDRDNADYEFGYECIVKEARAALKAEGEEI